MLIEAELEAGRIAQRFRLSTSAAMRSRRSAKSRLAAFEERFGHIGIDRWKYRRPIYLGM